MGTQCPRIQQPHVFYHFMYAKRTKDLHLKAVGSVEEVTMQPDMPFLTLLKSR